MVLFSQKKQGIIPEIVDSYYQRRVEIKKLLKKAKTKIADLSTESPEYRELQHNVEYLNIQQFTIKILINSIYGYFGNKHSSLGDDDIARSITLTGQAVIKYSNQLLIDFVKANSTVTDEDLKTYSPIIYNDTDSSYVSIKKIIEHKGIKLKDAKGKITKEYYNVVQQIEDYLNVGIKEWGTKVLKSTDCRLVFKREAIADAGLFLQKKRYVLHLLDVEGIPCNKFKYTGVEVVRTTMPTQIKPYVKRIIETMLTTKSLTETNKIFYSHSITENENLQKQQ
jgi:DNA polymerase elongation subunit (family B)